MIKLNFDYEEIYPLIFVYKKILNDPLNLYTILSYSEKEAQGKYYLREWMPWFIFGTYTHEKSFDMEADKDHFLYRHEEYFCNEVRSAINSSISHYVAKNNVNLPENAFISRLNFAKYIPGVSTSEYDKNYNDPINSSLNRILNMQYHTDYAIGEWYWPNDKFFITCNVYYNDNYDGGELRFFIDGDIVIYKPQAGDVVVFPSGSPLFPGNQPYFHAVGQVLGNEKFFTRSYVMYPWYETPEWIDGKKQYGEKDWPEIAKTLIKEDNTISFDFDPLKIEKKYKNISVWQSPLIEKLYNKNSF